MRLVRLIRIVKIYKNLQKEAEDVDFGEEYDEITGEKIKALTEQEKEERKRQKEIERQQKIQMSMNDQVEDEEEELEVLLLLNHVFLTHLRSPKRRTWARNSREGSRKGLS